MKWNVSEKVIIVMKVIGIFKKNVKSCLQNKKLCLMPPLRHAHFHLILFLLVKMVELPQQHANTTVR